MTRYLTIASMTAAIVAILLSCHSVLGWNLGVSSFMDGTFPALSRHLSGQQIISAEAALDRNVTPKWNVMEHLGGNSPWFRKQHGIASEKIDPPERCRVEQVHMISRHAERFPTVEAGIKMLDLHKRLLQANVTFKDDFAFLNDWEFFTDRPADAFESLVSTGPYAGTLEAFSTGVKLRTRYPALLEEAVNRKATTFWASDSRRVIDSARYFGAGFFGIDWERLTKLVIISEGLENGADTLTPGRTCLDYRYNDTEFGRGYGYRVMDDFVKSYDEVIRERLASQHPDLPFAKGDVFTMQMMCGFEIIARGGSPWCDVFTPEDMESFEYARDILHYYRAGPGNKYAAAMGWLWLNATANLLEAGPSEGPLFFSFVHDGDIVPLLHALDLFPQHPDLPSSHVANNRSWRTSDIVPMGGRLLFERLSCRAPQKCWSNAPLYPNHVYCEEEYDEVFVRINVNDGIVGIPGCKDGPGHSCPLNDFMKRVHKRGEAAGDFGEVCGLPKGASERITFLHQ